MHTSVITGGLLGPQCRIQHNVCSPARGSFEKPGVPLVDDHRTHIVTIREVIKAGVLAESPAFRLLLEPCPYVGHPITRGGIGISVIRIPNETTYAAFNNLSGGTLNINSASNWSFLSDSTVQGGILTNAGTINVNGLAGGNSTSWEALFSNLAGGTLNVGAAKLLSMQNGGTLGMSQGQARPISVTLSVQGSARARYIDADTGQVTITGVYAQ